MSMINDDQCIMYNLYIQYLDLMNGPSQKRLLILDRVCSTRLLFQKLIQAMPLTAEVVGEPGSKQRLTGAAISVLLALPMRNQTWDSGHSNSCLHFLLTLTCKFPPQTRCQSPSTQCCNHIEVWSSTTSKSHSQRDQWEITIWMCTSLCVPWSCLLSHVWPRCFPSLSKRRRANDQKRKAWRNTTAFTPWLAVVHKLRSCSNRACFKWFRCI